MQPLLSPHHLLGTKRGDALVAKKKPLSISVISKNVYNINDALGRAAYLRKDYPAACDYLLRARILKEKIQRCSVLGQTLASASSLDCRLQGCRSDVPREM